MTRLRYGPRLHPVAAPHPSIAACPCCGLVSRLPEPPVSEEPPVSDERWVARCARCGETLPQASGGQAGRRVTSRVAALCVTALALFPAALLLPVFEVQQFGRSVDASLWTGSVGLISRGEWLVGVVVLVCSVCLPVLKLSAMLLITAGRAWVTTRHRRLAWRLVEWTGRWGMLDVLLVAILVAWMKMGDLVVFSPGPGLGVFASVVGLSLLASAQYDPHALWEECE